MKGSARLSTIACNAPPFREADHVRILGKNKEKNMNIVQPPPSVLSPELLARFVAIVGDKYAVTDPHEAAPYLTEERGLFQGHSPLVLRPGSTAEVAAICKLASETRTALVPQGGNTGLVGGQTPHNGEVVLSLNSSAALITKKAGLVIRSFALSSR